MRHRYFPELHRRHGLRLPDNSYASFGVYYVTIVAHNRVSLFGTVRGGLVHLSQCGAIVSEEWLRTAMLRCEVVPDEFVIMPNHLHGILVLAARATDGDAATRYPDAPAARATDGDAATRPPDAPAARPYGGGGLRFGPQKSGTLPAIIGQFKSVTTKRINRLRGTPGAPVWQPRYYDRIVRSDDELNRIRRYILENPRRHP